MTAVWYSFHKWSPTLECPLCPHYSLFVLHAHDMGDHMTEVLGMCLTKHISADTVHTSHTHIHTYTYTHTHIHTYTYAHIHMHIHTRTYTHIHTYTHTNLTPYIYARQSSQKTRDVGGAKPAWDGPRPQTTAEAFAALALEALTQRQWQSPQSTTWWCTYHGEQWTVDKTDVIL